eukprot:TRINITY_DN525_c0_g2_i4.p2 TRINITY_DN525_c0_g2~~TRINITY_DN525_c0_g2_i4.p2  ORF type:complete len:583 (-),score=122.05 TRINITY_DN525_c0_g2_i4:459-2207(-)
MCRNACYQVAPLVSVALSLSVRMKLRVLRQRLAIILLDVLSLQMLLIWLVIKFRVFFQPEEKLLTFLDKEVCESLGNIYVDASTYPTPEICRDAAQVCNNGPRGSGRNEFTRSEYFTYRPQTACSACGGDVEPWFNWTNSTWAPQHVLIAPTWYTEVITLPQWGPQRSSRLFENLLERLRVKRLGSILASEIYCKFGIEGDILVYIGCSCGSHNMTDYCYGYLTSVGGSPVSELSVCRGVKVSKTIMDLSVLAEKNFTIDDEKEPCVRMKVDILPTEQFTFRETVLISSLALASETERARETSTSVFNANGVVVGTIIDGGYTLKFDEIGGFSNVKICINVTDFTGRIQWTLNSDPYSLGLAVATDDESGNFNFVPLESATIPYTDDAVRICAELIPTPYSYFPVALVENWQDVTIADTWTQEELGLMVFCAVMFILLACWVTWSLVMRLLNNKFKKFPRSELCLFSLLILSGLGAAYQIGTIVGTFDRMHLNPLFTDLPQLCLLTCVAITGATWHSLTFKATEWGKKQSLIVVLAPILFLFSLYLIFIALMIAAGVTEEERKVTCATTEDQKGSYTISQKN